MDISGNFTRRGVVSGFALAAAPYAVGLAPGLWRGVLFASGIMYRPAFDPGLSAAPANALSYVCYANGSGFYYTANPEGDDPDDAVIGWVLTDSTDVLAVSRQVALVGAVRSSGGGSGVGGTGTPSSGGGGTAIDGYALVPVTTLTPTLVGAITDSATSIVFSSASGLPEFPFYVDCGTETMLCEAGTGTGRMVSRGLAGTTAAAHASGATLTVRKATPNLANGKYQEVVLPGCVALFAPIDAGALAFSLMLQQNSTGGLLVTLADEYVNVDPARFDTTADTFITIDFEDPRALGRWVSVWGQSTALPLY